MAVRLGFNLQNQMSISQSIQKVNQLIREPSVSVGDAACLLTVSRQRVYNMLDAGKINRAASCGDVRVSLVSISQVLARRQAKGRKS
jgi:hypothetical protein